MDFDVLIAFFRDSLDSVNEGPIDFTLAVANSVVWACALDEALAENLGPGYARTRDAHPEGRVLDGVRLARNAILHGQTYAIQTVGKPYPTADEPLFYGVPLWKSYEQLTENWTPRSTRLRAAYERDVAGRNIGAPLWDAREWLDGVAERGWGL